MSIAQRLVMAPSLPTSISASPILIVLALAKYLNRSKINMTDPPIIRENHLPAFKKLNHQTYYDDASSSSTSSTDTNAPALILLCSWMNAHPRNVAKFIQHYRSTYPSTPILLVTASVVDFLYNPKNARYHNMKPALTVIHSILSTAPSSAQVLAHSFSNGGAGQMAWLGKYYTEAHGKPIPFGTVILDSGPGCARMRTGLKSLTVGLPQQWYVMAVAKPMFALVIILLYQLPARLGFTPLDQDMRKTLNVTSHWPKGCRRWYIYSDVDESILPEDVESHAKEAREKGMECEMVKFINTKHVAHMRSDPERYWGIVEKAWQSRIRLDN